MADRKSNVGALVLYLTGAILILLGLLNLLGWVLKIELFTRVADEYPYTSFNTGLCMSLIGAGLLFYIQRWFWITRLILVFVISITFITLFQYVSGVNFSIDRLFYQYHLDYVIVSPGRMSIETAVTFLSASICICFLTGRKGTGMIVAAVLLSCVTISIPVVSFFSFLFGIESIQGLAETARMALITMIGSLFLGFTLVITSLLESLNTNLRILLIPIAPSIVILMGSIGIWQAFRSQSLLQLKDVAEGKGEFLRETIDYILYENVTACMRMAERWTVLDGYSQEMWKVDAGNYIEDITALDFIEVFDSKREQVAFIAKNNAAPINFSLVDNDLQAKLRSGSVTFFYDADDNIIDCFFPLIIDSEYKGMLVAGLSVNNLVKTAVFKAGLTDTNFSIVFFHDNVVIAREGGIEEKIIGIPIQQEIDRKYGLFSFELFITRKNLELENFRIGIYVFILGFISMLLTGAVIYFALRYRNDKERLQKANTLLELAKSNAEIAMKSKDDFLKNISKKIHSPLHIVIEKVNQIELSLMEESQKKQFADIKHATNALLEMINNILFFSLEDQGEKGIEEAPCDLLEVCEKAIVRYRSMIQEKNLLLLFDVPAQPFSKFVTDGKKLEEILGHILSNAVKFSETGTIVFSVKLKELPIEKWEVIFSISDSGIGIPEENLSKLFHRYSKAGTEKKEISEGAGLGLSIAKNLTNKLGGTIGVRKNNREGITVRIAIRMKCAEGSQELPSRSLNGKTVLVYSNHAEETVLLKHFIQDWGGHVCEDFHSHQEVLGAILTVEDEALIQLCKQNGTPILLLGYKEQLIGKEYPCIERPLSPRLLWENICSHWRVDT